jgi:hypothetical protein
MSLLDRALWVILSGGLIALIVGFVSSFVDSRRAKTCPTPSDQAEVRQVFDGYTDVFIISYRGQEYMMVEQASALALCPLVPQPQEPAP